MSKKKTKPKSASRRSRRAKYIAVLVLILAASLSFGAVFGGWRNLPVIRNLVSPAPRVVQPTSPPTIPSPANPSREYIYSGSKLVAIETRKSDQTITFNSLTDKTYGDAPFSLSATASSGLSISFTVTSGPAAVSGSTLTITGAGAVSVRADQPGNDSFNPAQSITQSFNVAKATATVTLSNLTQTYDGAAHYASATTTPSNLSVNFSYSQSGTNVGTPFNAGSYSTVATVANSNYQGSATGTLTIAKAAQTITFNALADKIYGDAPFTVSASCSSGLSPGFAIVSGPATISGATVTLTGAGAVTVRASQAGNSNYNAASDVDRTFNVAKASATITLSSLSQTYDGSAKAVTATTNPSGLSGVAITYDGSATAPTNAGSYSVVASLTNANYQASNATGTLTIAKANQVITFNALADKTYTDAPFAVSASSSSGLSPGFSIVSGPATISGSTVTINGAGTVTVRASQTGNANYNAAADVDRTFNVAKASAAITLGNLSQPYDGSPKNVTATTTPTGLSGVAITYNGSATAPSNCGSYPVVASLTNANYIASNAAGTLYVTEVRTNVALAANGATATASSTLDNGRLPLAAINGDRKGIHWGSDPATGSGWHDSTNGTYADWLQIDFNGPKPIYEIDVFTLQDSYSNPIEPTSDMTFVTYGVTAFDVQYWSGSSWVTVPDGSVTGNNKVWRQFSFSSITTNKIRVLVNNALAGYSRLVEVEAWSRANLALAANGATATASSTLDNGRLPLAAINGDRKGIHWGSDPATGSGWHDSTNGIYPDWLQVDFNGSKTIDEIDLFCVQDNYSNPVDVTSTLTFTQYGVTDFHLQYWNGSAWVDVTGGNVTNNNLVWRRFNFAPITTTKIRVVISSTPTGPYSYSRIAELEAWGAP